MKYWENIQIKSTLLPLICIESVTATIIKTTCYHTVTDQFIPAPSPPSTPLIISLSLCLNSCAPRARVWAESSLACTREAVIILHTAQCRKNAQWRQIAPDQKIRNMSRRKCAKAWWLVLVDQFSSDSFLQLPGYLWTQVIYSYRSVFLYIPWYCYYMVAQNTLRRVKENRI